VSSTLPLPVLLEVSARDARGVLCTDELNGKWLLKSSDPTPVLGEGEPGSSPSFCASRAAARVDRRGDGEGGGCVLGVCRRRGESGTGGGASCRTRLRRGLERTATGGTRPPLPVDDDPSLPHSSCGRIFLCMLK
jgi:hypothetical protein